MELILIFCVCYVYIDQECELAIILDSGSEDYLEMWIIDGQ